MKERVSGGRRFPRAWASRPGKADVRGDVEGGGAAAASHLEDAFKVIRRALAGARIRSIKSRAANMPKMVSVLVLSIPVSIVEIVCCRTSWRLGSCIACPCHGQGMFFTRVKKADWC